MHLFSYSYLESYQKERPYVVRHCSWYEDPVNLPEEEFYYKEHCVYVTA